VDTAGVKHLRLSGGGVDDDGDDEKLVSGWRWAIEELVEAFQGAEFTWYLHSHDLPAGDPGKNVLSGKLYFELSFYKRHKETALKAYVPYIVATAKAIRDQERPLTIYMNDGSDWSAMDLHHPSTFATLAMDRALKQSVIDDLDKFVRRKAYYKRIGKRGRGDTCSTARPGPASPASCPHRHHCQPPQVRHL
jgi:hypothetical protein